MCVLVCTEIIIQLCGVSSLLHLYLGPRDQTQVFRQQVLLPAEPLSPLTHPLSTAALLRQLLFMLLSLT